ncbi:MAG: SPFH/Band 7/PHB domain protein [Candidatus Krumholzibacteriota bacterium]|nr:SPFH/Band 7/PHB domain protein [Candidatus Krumholzibacteriota bacterium]
MGFFVIVILIAFFVIVFSSRGLQIVKQAETMVIERLGKYHRTLGSGINIIWPIVERAREMDWAYRTEGHDGVMFIKRKKLKRIDLREAVYDFPRQNVITKDNVVIEINALLYFQITDPVKAVYEIANLPNAIEKLTQTTLRNVIGELDLDETLSSRDTINGKLQDILDEATDKWGVKVNRVELQDINPPKDIKEAMEKQMRAERDRRAAILEAEGMKRARILDAEGVKESDINKAEGSKRAKVLIAEGEAEARMKIAEAEAEAIRRITETIAQTGGDPSTYLIAIKYIETLKEMVSGKDNKVVYLPYEATGVLSSIGGIKEMLQGAVKS